MIIGEATPIIILMTVIILIGVCPTFVTAPYGMTGIPAIPILPLIPRMTAGTAAERIGAVIGRKRDLAVSVSDRNDIGPVCYSVTGPVRMRF